MITAKNKLYYLLLITGIAISGNAVGRVLTVGPDGEYALPSMAAKNSKDGDVIEINADGEYTNDHVKWKRHNLIIKGVNGTPHIQSSGNIKNGKGIWIIKGNNITIKNIELSGAKVRHRNGAAIRLVGANLHLSDCYIHDNENGLLGGKNERSEILIENCEFARNGHGKGKTHNIYIGRVNKFTIRKSYTHDANGGHTIKTRARNNFILYNRIFEGKASYAIDISNGGKAVIIGNIIHQGPETQNWAMVTFGPRALSYEVNELIFAYNALLNKRSSSVFVAVKKGALAIIENNIFSGKGKLVNGIADMNNNVNDMDIFKSFTAETLKIIKDKKLLLIDKASRVVDGKGDILNPEYQIVNGKVIKRNIVGNAYDVGPIEFE